MQLLFNVPPEADGVLLRGFLRRCAVSTELARAVKFHGSGFFAEDVPILANRRVQAGQVIRFSLPADGPGVEPQPEIPVRVVYEYAFAVVLEKPPHLAVHPTLNYPRDTLANGYAAWAAAHGESPVFRPVNRIDKDTSGLVLAAKNGYAAPLLAEGVEKLYYAIVEGELPLGPGVIDAPIGRRGDSIIGRCVTPEGKPSRTEYTILKAAQGLSLAACVPVTGRTHQIRVHFCVHRPPAGRRRPLRRASRPHCPAGAPLCPAEFPGAGLHRGARRHPAGNAGGGTRPHRCSGEPPARGYAGIAGR